MLPSSILRVAILLSVQAHLITASGEICLIHNLDADCRYRIDGRCLSHITVHIDQCQDPIAVQFTVTCEIPRVRFSHVFNKRHEIVPIKTFDRPVDLEVRLTPKGDDEINIEADFHVKGMASADFINHDAKLWGIQDHCPGLNKAAMIAVGVMCGLLAVVLAMIVVLLVIRQQRRLAKAAQSSEILVNQLETTESTESPGGDLDNVRGQGQMQQSIPMQGEVTGAEVGIPNHSVHTDTPTSGHDEAVAQQLVHTDVLHSGATPLGQVETTTSGQGETTHTSKVSQREINHLEVEETKGDVRMSDVQRFYI